MAEELQIRVHAPDARPTLVYLPGLHGDWTLIGGFREVLRNRARFVEITYPRSLTWSLDDYAAGVEEALAQAGIKQGWLLGESFGSQIVWPMLARKRFEAEGVIFAGGFARHPTILGVRLAERIVGAISLSLLTRVMLGYARIARFRYRRSPGTLSSIKEFVERRTRLDQQAAQHRLRLLTVADPRAIARQAKVAIYGLTGFFDPIVPWFSVRRWLRKNCPSLREYRIVLQADHNVLSTAPEIAVEQVLQWMGLKK